MKKTINNLHTLPAPLVYTTYGRKDGQDTKARMDEKKNTHLIQKVSKKERFFET
jgi:hypothetical protein